MLKKPFQSLVKILNPFTKRNYNRVQISGRLAHDDHCQKTNLPRESCCECTPSSNDQRCPKPHEQIFDLNCKTTVVIGGEKGIGYATAYEILGQKARVVAILGNDVCRGLDVCASLSGRFGYKKAVFFKADVNSESEIQCALCQITQDFGRIEVFVNSFATCHGKEWESELTTNLIGMARCTILAHQYLADCQRGGVIVNLAGIFGFVPLAGCPTTAAAQHGIIGLSRSFGKETLHKATNVRVITLCPGITDTHLFTGADQRALNAVMGKFLKEELQLMKRQGPDVCGKSIIWLLRFAESGSLWLIEGGGLYRIQCCLPHCCSQLYYQFPP